MTLWLRDVLVRATRDGVPLQWVLCYEPEALLLSKFVMGIHHKENC